jgi:hypothetical protein
VISRKNSLKSSTQLSLQRKCGRKIFVCMIIVAHKRLKPTTDIMRWIDNSNKYHPSGSAL